MAAKKNNVIKSQGKATAKEFRSASVDPDKNGSKTKENKSDLTASIGNFDLKNKTNNGSTKPAIKKGLGKGLDSLITNKLQTEAGKENNVSRETSAANTLNINLIDPNPNQPRKNFDEDSLQDLASSIKQHGLIQPIVVQKMGERYIIVAGERRWRAARLAGLKEVPVHIKDFTPQELFEAALIENIQRQDLNPIEEAEAYQVLIREFDLKQDEVADRVSKSRVAITNSLRLLNLDKQVRQLVVDGMLSGGHARALLAIKDPGLQYKTAMKVFDERLNVRDTEKLVKKLLESKPEKKSPAKIKPYDEYLIKDLEEKLKASLGSKVSINQKDGKKGQIVIEYYSNEELDRLYDMLRSVGK